MNDQNKIQNLSLFISRGFAFAIDNLVALIFVLGVYYKIKFAIDSVTLLIFICLLVYEFYFIVSEFLFHRTIGKRIMGLKVVFKKNKNSNGNFFKKFFKNFYEILIRNFTRVFIFIPPLFFWNELLIIIFTKGKTIRDLITSTSIEFSKKSFIQNFEKDLVTNHETFTG